ncbi:hypothetical protein BV394_01220 [Brevirhabdus pacifica]|uniref:Uncharacterized protein n=3 Tax=Brevirhabdus pacifica TaxID=1267768 RepID=A0A1U7DEZ3_9RHOB|nr:hypothetical protein [Brevirhabdus pacifica]APX88515.1 hypothetical protein BV394_01220 [Brevirhabdus pacifica]OWU79816.1 hypothetical protein ATO5_01920 [Loktanella sp. 22II-4b]PJJ87004.1 hypothetical protein CLV77_1566 [Brevirhabdus pacifica]
MRGFTLPDLALSPDDLEQASLVFAVIFLAIAFGLGRRVFRDLMGQLLPRARRARAGQFRSGLPIRQGDPAVGREGEVPRLVRRLMNENRWDELAELMRRAEEDERLYGDGQRLSHVVVEAAVAPIRQAVRAPWGKRAEMRAVERLLAPFRAAARGADGSSEILSLTALALIEAGWAAQGALAGRPATEEGTGAFHAMLQEAEGLLRQADPDAGLSSYMAEAVYMCGFVQPNPPAALSDRFSRWVMVNPTDCYPFEQRALHLMPGWYGTMEDVEALAERALRATAPVLGEGAYGRIAARLSLYLDPRRIPGFSHERISRSLTDLVARAGTQAAANRWAAWALAQGLDKTPRILVARFLREVHLDEWSPDGGYAEFYGLYARSRTVGRDGRQAPGAGMDKAGAATA